MFIVYILESESSGKWYYGYTERLEERISEHNSGNGHFTGGKGPWHLVFRRHFAVKGDALQFERELKKLKNKGYIKRVFAEHFLQNES